MATSATRVWPFGILFFTASLFARQLELVVNVPGSTEKDPVYVTGDVTELCRWKPDCLLLKEVDVGVRKVQLSLPDSVDKLRYKITRGAWEREAAKPSGEKEGEVEIQLPKDLTVVRTVVNWTDKGPLRGPGYEDLGDIRSPQLGNDRRVTVWLPSSYALNPLARYPVLYMHDGQNVLDPKRSTWGVSWEVAETISRLSAAHEIREAIVVAADCTRERETEYDYAKSGARYADFLVSTLKPLIDARYRTQPQRENTFLMGASMGALISLTTLWHHPETFARAAGLSFPAFYDRESTATVIRRAAAPKQPVRFYLDYGDYGGDAPYEPSVLRFVTFWPTVAPTSATLTHRKVPYADHNEAAWARRVSVPLRFLLQD